MCPKTFIFLQNPAINNTSNTLKVFFSFLVKCWKTFPPSLKSQGEKKDLLFGLKAIFHNKEVTSFISKVQLKPTARMNVSQVHFCKTPDNLQPHIPLWSTFCFCSNNTVLILGLGLGTGTTWLTS